MLTTPLFAGLGVAAWSKVYAKHNVRTSVLYFIAVFLAVWILMNLATPKERVQEEQKKVGGFSVTGSGEP